MSDVYLSGHTNPSASSAGLHDLMRVITRPDKPLQDEDEDEEVLADEEEAEDGTDEDDDDDAEDVDSDAEMTDAAALEAGVDEEAERPQGMDVDNGVPSTSDRVSPACFPQERRIVVRHHRL